MIDAYQPGEVHEVTPPKSDIQALREFADWVIRETWDHGDVDGGDIQGQAEALGLIAEHTVLPDEVGLFGDSEAGDIAYIMVGPLGPNQKS
jgi:hypothetical protein